MDQSRLNFLKSTLNSKNYFFKNYFLLKLSDLEFDEIYSLKDYNNNYYKKKKLNKKINLNNTIKLKKVFDIKQINNIMFF